jgi:hypothetical protein
MATSGGPNIITDGLVFGYDTGYPLVSDNNDSYKFNKGAPTTNLYTNSDFSNGETGWTFGSWDGNITHTATTLIGPYGETVSANKLTKNATSAYSHFHQYNQSKYASASTYTTSAWVKGSGTFQIKSHWGGNTSFTMTGDWQRVSMTVTATSSNSSHFPYFAGESLTTGTDFYITMCQTELKGHATPYVYSGATPGSRSVSGSLIDLTRTTDIDLSNVSFDSNAQMTFDGTDDSILLTPRVQYSTGSAWTAELIFEPTTTGSWNGIFGGHLNAGGYWMFHNNQNLTYYEGSSAESGTRISYKSWSIGNTFTLNQDHHLTITYTPTTAGSGSFALYYNGGEKVDTFDYGFYWANSLDMKKIGSGDSNRYGTNNIKIFKFYNKTLTAVEVKQNYNALKSRFELP